MPNGDLGIPKDCKYGQKVVDEFRVLWRKYEKLDDAVDRLNVEVGKMNVRIMIFSALGAFIGTTLVSGAMTVAVGIVMFIITKGL